MARGAAAGALRNYPYGLAPLPARSGERRGGRLYPEREQDRTHGGTKRCAV